MIPFHESKRLSWLILIDAEVKKDTNLDEKAAYFETKKYFLPIQN